MYEKELSDILLSNGATMVGFCKLPDSEVKFTGLNYAISIACKLSSAVIDTIVDRPSIIYFQHYRTANARLDQLSFTASMFIEDKGYLALPIAASQSDNTGGNLYTGVFQHKTTARLSGLGFIGKSGLLITKEFGPAIRFSTVLTSMPLTPQREVIQNGCGSCDKCVQACPAGAISGKVYEEGMKREEFFSAEKCSTQMKTYKDIGRGAVCGLCIKACPYTKLNSPK